MMEHDIEELAAEYASMLAKCEALDYSDLDAVFWLADSELSCVSWELALVVMINVLIREPRYYDEDIADHIAIAIESEGNQSTYAYLKSKLASCTDDRIRRRIENLCAVLERKYPHLSEGRRQ